MKNDEEMNFRSWSREDVFILNRSMTAGLRFRWNRRVQRLDSIVSEIFQRREYSYVFFLNEETCIIVRQSTKSWRCRVCGDKLQSIACTIAYCNIHSLAPKNACTRGHEEGRMEQEVLRKWWLLLTMHLNQSDHSLSKELFFVFLNKIWVSYLVLRLQPCSTLRQRQKCYLSPWVNQLMS